MADMKRTRRDGRHEKKTRRDGRHEKNKERWET